MSIHIYNPHKRYNGDKIHITLTVIKNQSIYIIYPFRAGVASWKLWGLPLYNREGQEKRSCWIVCLGAPQLHSEECTFPHLYRDLPTVSSSQLVQVLQFRFVLVICCSCLSSINQSTVLWSCNYYFLSIKL